MQPHAGGAAQGGADRARLAQQLCGAPAAEPAAAALWLVPAAAGPEAAASDAPGLRGAADQGGRNDV